MINTRKLCALLLCTVMHTTPAATTTTTPAQHLDLKLPSTDSKKQKSRMRKSKSEKIRKISSYRDMTYDELVTAKNKLIEANNTISAIKYLEQMITLCDDVTLRCAHTLEIADLIFADGNYQKASQRYAEYALLYPGNDNLEYALSQAIISSHYCLLSHDRDQTKTEETLALTDSFLKQDHFITHRDSILAIQKECINKLVDSELDVCSFYAKRHQFKAAEKRLESVRNTWLVRDSSLETRIVALENDIAQQKNEIIQKTEKKQLLAQNKQEKRMTERF